MPTLSQLIRNKRVTKKMGLNKTPALKKSPQKYGTCLSIFNKTPRKPNSALRKVAKVRLSNFKIITAFIPGEGHNISRFSDIIVAGRRIRDLPGVKYGALRGKLDLEGVGAKRCARSKYGTKRPERDIRSPSNPRESNTHFLQPFDREYLLRIEIIFKWLVRRKRKSIIPKDIREGFFYYFQAAQVLRLFHRHTTFLKFIAPYDYLNQLNYDLDLESHVDPFYVPKDVLRTRRPRTHRPVVPLALKNLIGVLPNYFLDTENLYVKRSPGK